MIFLPGGACLDLKGTDRHSNQGQSYSVIKRGIESEWSSTDEDPLGTDWALFSRNYRLD